MILERQLKNYWNLETPILIYSEERMIGLRLVIMYMNMEYWIIDHCLILNLVSLKNLIWGKEGLAVPCRKESPVVLFWISETAMKKKWMTAWSIEHGGVGLGGGARLRILRNTIYWYLGREIFWSSRQFPVVRTIVTLQLCKPVGLSPNVYIGMGRFMSFPLVSAPQN